MNTLTNMYAYSKNKSQTMFTPKKQKKMVEEKKWCTCVKACRVKYEETKQASYVFMMNIYDTVKKTSNDIHSHLSTFTFKSNGKYSDYPWYTRIYLILKDNIKRIMKIEYDDVTMNATDENEETKEMQTDEHHSTLESTPDAPNNHISTDVSVTQNVYGAQYHNGTIYQRNKNFLKRTNSEVMEEKVNTAAVEKTHSSNFNLASRSRNASLINSIVLLNKFTHPVEEKKTVEGTEEVTQLHVNEDVNGATTTVDNSFEIGTTEPSATEKMPLSNTSDSGKTDISEMTDSKRKNFNIKNAWTKFNNLLI